MVSLQEEYIADRVVSWHIQDLCEHTRTPGTFLVRKPHFDEFVKTVVYIDPSLRDNPRLHDVWKAIPVYTIDSQIERQAIEYIHEAERLDRENFPELNEEEEEDDGEEEEEVGEGGINEHFSQMFGSQNSCSIAVWKRDGNELNG